MRERRSTPVRAALFILVMTAFTAAAQEPAVVDTVALARLSPEELFVRASSAELQFAEMLQPSRRILIRDHERSLPYLLTQLDTDGPRERHALEDILVKIGQPAVEPLASALVGEARRIDTTRGARLAAGILGRLGDGRAIDALASLVGHDDWKLRSAVAEALGRIGGDRVVAPVVEMMSDENEIVRKSAAVSLRRVAAGGDDLGGDAIDALATLLSDPHYSARTSAAAALGAAGEEAVSALLRLLKSDDPRTRHAAVVALGATGCRSSVPALVGLLDSGSWTDRGCAVEALGSIGIDGDAGERLARLRDAETHPFVLLKLSELPE